MDIALVELIYRVAAMIEEAPEQEVYTVENFEYSCSINDFFIPVKVNRNRVAVPFADITEEIVSSPKEGEERKTSRLTVTVSQASLNFIEMYVEEYRFDERVLLKDMEEEKPYFTGIYNFLRTIRKGNMKKGSLEDFRKMFSQYLTSSNGEEKHERPLDLKSRFIMPALEFINKRGILSENKKWYYEYCHDWIKEGKTITGFVFTRNRRKNRS